ncbi:G-protein coupled receptor Mth2-like [Alphaentomopoxvirus acuprea]|uniref:G-protein coupled receptor Mth2-like n=1 Tax=Alphaentomopoxvirus acuprea TaxID=62099 RepID=W6JKZ9_9POXV|nr:G-protein coupled receptor Mth2-like [Anomala cuprea entomopoxvirus]BAO49480.1 G-protein coupled receptor Mth2-like [Anomala cuprea entomopoxvirus]
MIYVLLILFVELINAQHNCCDNINIINNNKTCDDGTTIKLKTCNSFIFMEYDNSSEVDILFTNESYCLTNFNNTNIGIICYDEKDQLNIAPIICIIISICCLIITIIIFIIIPKNLYRKCIIHFISNLTFAFISLTIVQLNNNIGLQGCVFWAFSIYFSFLATFFWLNILSINIWKNIVISTWSKKSDNHIYYIYFAYGYGCPIIFTLAAIITHNLDGNHIKPGFGDGMCFLSTPIALLSYFYGPIGILLIINLILFIWILIILQNLNNMYLIEVKLFIIMGITWLFEIMSYYLSDIHYLSYLWAITDYINAIQGILIFLVLIVFDKQTHKDLYRKWNPKQEIVYITNLEIDNLTN